MGTTFVCHKTVDYGLFGTQHEQLDRGRRTCAGFLLVCQKDGLYEGLQIVQIAKRLAGIEFHLRGTHITYNSFQEAMDAQEF